MSSAGDPAEAPAGILLSSHREKGAPEDYAISELDAYELLGKVAKIHLTEMVDPNYVIVAGIDKRDLPPKR